jgi:hypothetical protein
MVFGKALSGYPFHDADRHTLFGDVDPIVAIPLAAPEASRDRRTRMQDKDRTPPANLRNASAQGAVMVTGKQQVNPGICDRFERQPRPSGQFEGSLAARYSQRMVRHEGLECLLGYVTEHAFDLRDLPDRNTAILAGEAASGIEAKNGKLVVLEETGGVAYRQDIMIVFGEWSQKPGEHVVKRHVVIAWNYQFRLRNAIKKSSCFGELGMASALCEITAKGDQIETVLIHAGEEILHNNEIMPPEMKVRDVSDRTHGNTLFKHRW